MKRRILLGAATATGLVALAGAEVAEAAVPRTDAEIYGVPTAQPLIRQRFWL